MFGTLMTLLSCCVVMPSLGEVRSKATATGGNRVDSILTRMEQKGEEITDIRCRIVLAEEDRINLSKTMKFGSILFLKTEPNPNFLVQFNKTQGGRVLGKKEWYLFDGRWLFQAVERIRQVTKQEIVRPGEKVDFFDLETAPFPLPFGQKKEAILKNFSVAYKPPHPTDKTNTDHLLCVPKPTSRLYGKYDKLDFFISKKLGLPIKIVITKNDGLEVNTAYFADLSEHTINVGLTQRAFKHPKEWKDYEVVVEKLPPVATPSP